MGLISPKIDHYHEPHEDRQPVAETDLRVRKLLIVHREEILGTSPSCQVPARNNIGPWQAQAGTTLRHPSVLSYSS